MEGSLLYVYLDTDKQIMMIGGREGGREGGRKGGKERTDSGR